MLAICLANSSYAQPGTTYGERYTRAVEDNNRLPNTPSSNSGSATTRVPLMQEPKGLTAQELAELKIYRDKKASELKIATDMANFQSKYDSFFINCGVDAKDAPILGKKSVYKDRENSYQFESCVQQVSYLTFFNTNINTYTFEKLSSLIDKYTDLPLTALQSCDQLQQRFSEKKAETDVIRLKILPAYYNNNRDFDKIKLPYIDKKAAATYAKEKQIDDMYRSIYTANPDKVEKLLLDEKSNNFELYRLANLFYLETTGVRKGKLPLDIFDKKLNYSKQGERLRALYLTFPNKNILSHNTCYALSSRFEKSDFEGRLAFAKFHSIPLIYIAIGFEDPDIFNLDSVYYVLREDIFKKRFPEGYKVLLRLVEMEDADAMTMYALRIYNGFEKVHDKKYFEWLKKAADKGSERAGGLLYDLYGRHQK